MKFRKIVFYALTLLVLFAGFLNASGLENGAVMNVQGEPKYYFYINGYAAHIPSPPVFQCMELGERGTIRITRQHLDAMPKTAFLVRGSDYRVYRVDGDTKRHVPGIKVFKKLGFNEKEIIDISDEALHCIKTGPPLQ